MIIECINEKMLENIKENKEHIIEETGIGEDFLDNLDENTDHVEIKMGDEVINTIYDDVTICYDTGAGSLLKLGSLNYILDYYDGIRSQYNEGQIRIIVIPKNNVLANKMLEIADYADTYVKNITKIMMVV